MAAPLKYNQAYHDDWAWSLAIKGATDVEIAEAFGISVRTLNRWKKDHESFMLALTAGKDQADAKVEKKLYERAIGYRYTEKEIRELLLIQRLHRASIPQRQLLLRRITSWRIRQLQSVSLEAVPERQR